MSVEIHGLLAQVERIHSQQRFLLDLIRDEIDDGPTVHLIGPQTVAANTLFTVNVVFERAVTGFEEGDIAASNTRSVELTGGGDTYALEVRPALGYTGSLHLTIPAGAAVDDSNRGNQEAHYYTVVTA